MGNVSVASDSPANVGTIDTVARAAAAAAQTTADEAGTSAAAAQTSANGAQTTAEGAQGLASLAGSVAAEAQTTINTHIATTFTAHGGVVGGNVMGYGADPTGVQLSDTAIASCLTANGFAVFPAGTWKISNYIVLSTNQALFGLPGSKLLLSADNVGAIKIVADNCIVDGLEIDCASRPVVEGIYVCGSYNTIRNCFVHHSALVAGNRVLSGALIRVDGILGICQYNKIYNNRLSTAEGAGVYQYQTSYCRYEQNKISGCWWGVVNYLSSRNIVCDNYMQNIQTEGVTVDGGSWRTKLLNNTLQDCCLDNAIAPGFGSISIDNSGEVLISGNTIYGNPNKSGICTANVEGHSNSLIITNNHIVNVFGNGIWLFAGAVGRTGQCVVQGNSIYGASIAASIRIDVGCNNNECRYNQLNNIPVANSGTGNMF